MHNLTRKIHQKGYSNSDVAKRWGLTGVRLSQITAKPKRIHYDAVNGLPLREFEFENNLEKD